MTYHKRMGQIEQSKVVAEAIRILVSVFDCSEIDKCNTCGLSIVNGNGEHFCMSKLIGERIEEIWKNE